MNDESAFGQASPAHAARPPVCDRIFLRDHVADVEIGAYADEYGVTQRLRFTITLDVLRFSRDYADEVANVVSYDLILDAIRDIAAGPRMKLLETYAERLAERLLEEPRVTRAHICIEKLDRVAGSLGVEMERARAL